MKTVYKVSGNTYEEWQAPESAIIVRPFTDVEPPKDQLIAGYDWEKGAWIAMETVDKDQYQKIVKMAGQNAMALAKLQRELDALKGGN